MNPELTYSWWSNNKAKTLLKEPLSAALKNIEKEQEKLAPGQKTYRAEDATSLLIKMRTVLEAIDATIKMCIAGIHGTTKENLTRLKILATQKQQELRARLNKFEEELRLIGDWRTKVFVYSMEALKAPSQDALEKIQKACVGMGQCATKASFMHASFATLTLNGGGTQGGGIWGVCDKFRKHLNEKGPNVAKIMEEDKRALRLQVDSLAKVKIG